jgi:type VI protein secretion system component Hcp
MIRLNPLAISIALATLGTPAFADQLTLHGARGTVTLSALVSRRDIATGQASGKRQWKPIMVSAKEWGAATPQLTGAGVLPEVTVEFTKTNPNGEEYVYHSVTLTNATVSAVEATEDAESLAIELSYEQADDERALDD